MADLGGRLRMLRLQRDMTQAEVGQELGVGKSTISQYEGNVRKPDADMLAKISQYFGVTTDFLLGLDEQLLPGLKTTSQIDQIEVGPNSPRIEIEQAGRHTTITITLTGGGNEDIVSMIIGAVRLKFKEIVLRYP